LPRDEDELRLSLAELAELASGPLPRGAWTSVYWSNSTVSRKNWGRLGFAAAFDRHSCTVTFRRSRRERGEERLVAVEHRGRERVDTAPGRDAEA
jgi:hypothetical protein